MDTKKKPLRKEHHKFYDNKHQRSNTEKQTYILDNSKLDNLINPLTQFPRLQQKIKRKVMLYYSPF